MSKHIFEKVVGPNGCLSGRTRILVTHKLSLLPSVDAIIYIERGRIDEPIVPFDQLISSKGRFSEYVAEYFLDRLGGDTSAEVGDEDSTKLDEEELQFMSSLEPSIKHALEKLELSRSTSVKRKISTEFGASGGPSRRISTVSRQRSVKSGGAGASIASSLTGSRHSGSGRQTSASGRGRPILTPTTGKLTATEGMAEGAVNLSNHRKYFATIGYLMCAAILLSLALSNVFQVFSSLWLSDWSNDAFRVRPVEVETGVEDDDDTAAAKQRNRRVIVYAIFGTFESLFAFLGTLGIYLMTVQAAKILHNRMLSGVLRAPMSFFGKINFLNIFKKLKVL